MRNKSISSRTRINPWAEYAKELKEADRKAEQAFFDRHGLIVETETAGWTGNFSSERYLRWLERRPDEKRKDG